MNKLIFPPWDNEEEKTLKKLLQMNQDKHSCIQNFLKQHPNTTKSTNAISKKIDRLKKLIQVTSKSLPTVTSVSAPSNSATNVLNEINQIQARYYENSVTNRKGLIQTSGRQTKILALSDIHFPFADTTMLQEVLSKESDADIVVINGDLLDGYVYSTFTKDKLVYAIHEYRCAFNFVKFLSENFPKVILVKGNHDDRLERAFKELGWTNTHTSLLSPDLIGRIANGEEIDANGKLIHKHNFTNVFYDHTESWYVRIGSAIFFHPHDKGNSTAGSTVRKWADKFIQRYGEPNIDTFVCGHVHKVYEGVVNGYKMIEQGCLVGYQSYGWSPRNFYQDNTVNGYAVLYQDVDGKTDYNKSHAYYLGTILPSQKGKIT